MLTLEKEYEKCCGCMKPPWTPRLLIKSMLKEFEDDYIKNNGSVAFLQLPTGYGKSTITLALAYHILFSQEFNNNSTKFGRSVIHVLPLRSIITDLSARLSKWFPKVGLDPSKIRTQHMGDSGSPFFAKPVVITTLDTFALNFFKLPAVEVSKAFKSGNTHFEIPRGFIYSSILLFDEAHLFALDSGDYKQLFTIFVQTLVQLASTGVPLFIITATLPTPIRKYIQQKLKMSGVNFIDRIYSRGNDPLFENTEGKRSIVTYTLLSDSDALNIIQKNEHKKILVVVNEVPRAIMFYENIRNRNCILLHGRMVESERKENIKEINNSDAWVIIGTQVIEAGVDIDANILITDLAPMDRLVQRVGRVARSGNGRRGEVYVIENYSKVYLEHDLKRSMCILHRYDENLDWTLEAQELVDEAYSNLDVNTMIDNNLSLFLKEIDGGLLYGSGEMKKLLYAIDAFPREAVLIKAYAPQFFNDGILIEKEGYFGLDSSRALSAVYNSKRAIKNGKLVSLDGYQLKQIQNDNFGMQSRLMMSNEGFDGILLDHYKERVGYI